MRLVVFGAGVSGRAAVRLARSRGHVVTVYDESPVDPAGLLDLGVGIVSGAWDPFLLDGADVVVTSPGFSERSRPIVETLEHGLPVWSEIELAWRCLGDVPVLAVTGTNGKTTVTALTARMLADSGRSAVAAGNIGTALSDVADLDLDVAVVEVSSFQLRFVDRFHPTAAAVVNVAIDHLDWHGSAESYTAAKARIFERQGPGDLLVFDADDEGASRLVSRAASDLHPVSAHRIPPGGSGRDGETLRFRHPGGIVSVPVEQLGSTDPAHIVDLLCAGTLALHHGAEAEPVADVMATFEPGPHRRTRVGSVGGVDYVDDSKATNPHAALAAIGSYPSVVLIAGGLDKGLDLSPLAAVASVRGVVGIGTAGPALVEAAGERGRWAGSMEAAVAIAADLALPGDTVLLAPGAASFDQFESYAARGEAFCDAVRRLEDRAVAGGGGAMSGGGGAMKRRRT